MGLLVVWQVLKIFDRIDDGQHWVGQTLVPWHVSIGTLILVLVMIRIGWALRNRHRRPRRRRCWASLPAPAISCSMSAWC